MEKNLNNFILAIVALFLTACASQSTLEKYQTKADEGDTETQVLLAESYYFGTSDLPKNKKKALSYYQLAADSGSASAAFSLGVIYQQDNAYDQSVFYYQKASELDHAGAQDNLAILYQYGTGVEKDMVKAEQLYLKALVNGSEYSKRNLAVLYRDTQQTDKAIDMFEQILFDPTTKNNPYRFKKAVALELMDLYQIKKDQENAYIWGSVAVLSGLFDSNIEHSEQKSARYKALADTLTDIQKDRLAESVLTRHYKAFQHYETAIEKYKTYLVHDGIIVLPTKELVSFTAYKVQMKKDIYGAINFYKGKEDKKSRINFALHTLKLAAYHISLGALTPHLNMARSNIEESIHILNDYNDNNLANLKANSALKLDVLSRVTYAQQGIANQEQITE